MSSHFTRAREFGVFSSLSLKLDRCFFFFFEICGTTAKLPTFWTLILLSWRFVFSQCVLAVAVASSCLNMRLLTDFLLWRVWFPGILLPRRSESMSFAVLFSITLVQLGVTGHVSDSARSTLFVAVRLSPSLACWRPTHLSPRTARAARWRVLLALP